MSIFPLPVFENELAAAKADQEIYNKLKAPTSIVIRFGVMKLVGEFPYSGDSKPGCGSKIVARTHRGLELGEMLTSTCPNAGCSKSVTRQEMLEYIENSGGKDYPFFDQGRIIRIATTDDLNEQRRIDALKPGMKKFSQEAATRLGLNLKVVECEPILGGERLTIYYISEDRIDFRELVTDLAREFQCRIEMRQVGARDEARLVADYERCGQHCCCKQFLKVLKPISMKAAKTQKATLDPLKISGRCGRLMCCLRYEDQTYTELEKRLPRLKSRVGTPEGVGIVIDRQILTQLVLVILEGEEAKRVAIAVEDLVSPEEAIAAMEKKRELAVDALRGMSAQEAARRARGNDRGAKQERQRDRTQRAPGPGSDRGNSASPDAPAGERPRDNDRRPSRDARGDRGPRPPRAPRPPLADSAPGSPASPGEPLDTAGAPAESLDRASPPREGGADGPDAERRRRRRRRGRGPREGGPASDRGGDRGGEGGGMRDPSQPATGAPRDDRPREPRESRPPRDPNAPREPRPEGDTGEGAQRRRRRRRRRGGPPREGGAPGSAPPPSGD